MIVHQYNHFSLITVVGLGVAKPIMDGSGTLGPNMYLVGLTHVGG